MDVATVVTSAAVGAVSAAVVNVIGQGLERRSRRKELLLAKAVELAVERVRLLFDAATNTGQRAGLPDPGVTCATYYRWLRHLLETGEPAADAVHQVPRG